ncbi:DUF6453 family protein [Pectobacterium carotovorum]|uniref:DUF6453 family protein n=1 Tax=Pectobacterium carotovorum TaxID=554 RepID=UPI0015DDFD47|nr:DUF6453 family protein [Pectobacterium carotovorum]MBA0175102.1 hypothetical protein [Pectobacterium carotovorum]
MADAGIIVYSPILGKDYVLRSDSRIITGLGMVTNNAEWNYLPTPASPNSQIIYNITDCVAGRGASTLVEIELNSTRDAIRFKSRNGTDDPARYFYGPINPWNTNPIYGSYPTYVYEVGGAQAQGFGLKLASGTNYNEIKDATKAGCLVYKYSGSVKHLHELPSNIPNIKNAIVYARWSTQDNVSVVLNDTANSKQFGLWTPAFSEVPQPYGGTLQMDILVFASGHLISPVPSGQVGINVFNELGQCTFSSYNPPIMLNGTINFNAVTAQQWSALPTPNSMIPLSSSYGTCTILTAASGPGGESWYMLHILDIGVSMRDGQYRIFQANHSNGILMPVANPQFHRRFAVLNANVPTLDASFYL